ncbi:MAG: glycosyltransferase [Planctomycetota bacterium]
MTEPITVSVVVPTYRRPDVLHTCLRALERQQHPPVEVLVCRRETDTLTADSLAQLTPESFVRQIVVGPDDHFAKALHAGITASCGELVALTDDDAEAPPDWIERLVAGFTAPGIAGVGGRDLIEGASPTATKVGTVQWFGRLIGNHHIGMGLAREVDVLKGVNCCFRGELARSVGIDPRLRGSGTVIHTEMSLCLPLRRAGYRMIYDPSIKLTHHAAPRGDGDRTHRGGFNAKALEDIVHNQTLQLLDYLPFANRGVFFVWSLIVGTKASPGLLLLPHTIVRDGVGQSLARCWATAVGRIKGLATALLTRRTIGLPPQSSEGAGQNSA